MTEAVPQERARKISVVDTLDNARRALSTHRQWLQRRLSVEEDLGVGYNEPESRDTTEDRQWVVDDIEDAEEQKSEAITHTPPTPPSVVKRKRSRKSSIISPTPALDSLIEEEEIGIEHRVDWATKPSNEEDEDGVESLQESPKSKKPMRRWGITAKVSPAHPSCSPLNTHNTVPSSLEHIFTSSTRPAVTEIATESEHVGTSNTYTSAWGSLSSLDNYMESLEEKDEPPEHLVETDSFPAPEFATTSAVSLHLSSSDDDSCSDSEKDSILHNLRRQQLPDITSLKSRSAPKSPCNDHKVTDSKSNDIPTPLCEREQEVIDITSLQSNSVAMILPVVPAPKDKQSSYEIHQYSKLEQAGKGLRVIEIKDRADDPQLEATDHHLKLVLGEKTTLSNTGTLETVVEDVLPYNKSDSTSTTDDAFQTAVNTSSDLPGHNLNSSQVSLPTHSVVDDQQDVFKDSAHQSNEKDDTKSKDELKRHARGDISFNPRVTSTPAPGIEVEQKAQEQESSDQRRRQILQDLQLPPLKENRIGGARSILSRLPRLKSTTPTSPTNTGISTDLKLFRKRHQELPSYTTHHCRMAGSQALNPPCPQYGVKQPEEKIPQRKRLYSAPSVNPLPSSPHTPPLRHKKMSLHTPITRKRYSSTGSPLLMNKSFDGSSNSPPASPVMKRIKRPSSAKERGKHPPLRQTVSGPTDSSTLLEPEDKLNVLRRGSAGVVSPLLRAQTSSDGSLTKADSHRGSVVSLYQMHSGPGPLHLSAKSGNLRQLQYLLSQGENVDVRDHEGRTPLMYCIHSKGVHLSCASFLIQEHASLDKQASDGSTVIHLAAAVGALSLIELAIINEADPDIKDFEGRLPLHWSTMTLQSSKCSALLLKHSKLDINAVDDAGMTALMWAAYNNNPLVTAFLLSKGAECEEKDMDGMTAMHWAVHQEGTKCLELLLKSDHTYFKDHKGRTVLHLSAEVGCVTACELVLGLRSDAVHDLDRMGRTPLHYAAACSRVDVCALLLDRGSDASLRDLTGKTAIEYARRNKFDYVVALLTCHGTAVADFARVSLSNSISSLLNRTTSFSELSAVSDEEVSANTDIITESLLPLTTTTTREQESGDVMTQSSGSATNLYKGAFLGRFVQDKNDPLQHFYFWLTEHESKRSLLRWSRKSDKRRPQQATVYEVHGGPSKSLRQNPVYSANELHQHVFWILTDCGVFDMLAYNETAYEIWTSGLAKIACGAPEEMVENKGQDARELQLGKMFGLKGKRSASVAPALKIENEAMGNSSIINDSSLKDGSHGYNSDSEVVEFRSTPDHTTPVTIATTNKTHHQTTKLQGSPQNDTDDII